MFLGFSIKHDFKSFGSDNRINWTNSLYCTNLSEISFLFCLKKNIICFIKKKYIAMFSKFEWTYVMTSQILMIFKYVIKSKILKYFFLYIYLSVNFNLWDNNLVFDCKICFVISRNCLHLRIIMCASDINCCNIYTIFGQEIRITYNF